MKKISESTKTCLFRKRYIAFNSITNRALEKAIENEARRYVGDANRNYFLLLYILTIFCECK